MGQRRICAVSAGWGIGICLLEAFISQSVSAQQTADSVTTRPTAQMTRIPESERPVIDGDLSDPVWTKATKLEKFYQIEPDNGAEPTERTIVYLAYDKDNFYFGIHAYDSEPDKIVATLMVRDGGIFRDDQIRFSIDPNTTRRDAYNFEMNPLGGYTDALIQNNADFFSDWNSIYEHQAKRTDDGWTAEMAIPFRNFSYDPNRTEWGFDFIRMIRRKNERVRWAPTPASVNNNDLTLSGTLTGLQGMDQGLGLDITAYALARYRQDWQSHDGTSRISQSANAYYKITSGLTGTLTFNTDFSDAPLDKRQVNTTRFSLFTPETRQFFLQDAASYEFGGRGYLPGGNTSNNTFGQALVNGRPFFSRNIGLVNGVPVGIEAGGKISGQYDGVNIGLLTVRTADTIGVAKPQQLSVARVTVPVFSQSRAGIIVTNGDPTGLSKNTLAGADFQYYDTSFLPGQRIQADLYYQRSFSSTRGDDNAGGIAINLPNEPWGAELYIKTVGKNYVPALGFANRVGVNEYRGKIEYKERLQDSYLRWWTAGTKDTLVTGLNNKVQSRENAVYGNISNNIGDSLTFTVLNSEENVAAPFYLPGHVLVPAGRYVWNHFNPHFESSVARPFSVTWDIDCCTFYNGSYFKSDLTVNWRISRYFSTEIQHVINQLDMPMGNTDVHIGSIDFQVNFTADMQWRTQVQYDNITKQFAVSARYRWEYEPGAELFFAIGENATITDQLLSPSYRPTMTQAVLRLGHTFRF